MNNIPHANKSFWLAHSGEYIPSPPLKGSIDVDVVIIGGGFTGLSTAYHIKKPTLLHQWLFLKANVWHLVPQAVHLVG